jgi:hypothetical protein
MSSVDGSGEAVPGHRPIDDTDLEISYNMRGDDLVLRINKSGILVFRVLLEHAAKEMSAEHLCTDVEPMPYKVRCVVTHGPMLLLDVQRHRFLEKASSGTCQTRVVFSVMRR